MEKNKILKSDTKNINNPLSKYNIYTKIWINTVVKISVQNEETSGTSNTGGTMYLEKKISSLCYN